MTRVVQTLALCPKRGAHILQSVTTEDTQQRNRPRLSHSTNAKQTKSSGKNSNIAARFFLLSCCFLDSRKKKQNREGSHFSPLKGLRRKVKRKKSRIYNLIFFHCRRTQQIKSTRLQTHSSKATFLSLSPGGQAERRDKRAGEERETD